jgi:hypothetical protein
MAKRKFSLTSELVLAAFAAACAMGVGMLITVLQRGLP